MFIKKKNSKIWWIISSIFLFSVHQIPRVLQDQTLSLDTNNNTLEATFQFYD